MAENTAVISGILPLLVLSSLIICCDKQDKEEEHSIVLVGEVKGMAADESAEFLDEEAGQILDFLKELLLVQGWRKWAFGFLTDTFRFEFFRAVRGRMV
jgi:hypothetical protein